jgi:hypothetical protein
MSVKKEFSKSTVQRMRNIITGNAGDKTQIQTGYEKHIVEKQEGDIWEQDGKKWTIKNGIKQSITKFDRFKDIAITPICCPKCKKSFKLHDINKKMYSIHRMCLDCVTKMETQIKLEGNWAEYKSNILNNNKNASLEDFEKFIDSWMLENSSFVTENGDVESWSKVDKTKAYEEIKTNIQKLKNTKI